jgi:hypothetical protein
LHGLVEQIPETFYVASLARTQRIATAAGTFSIHRLAPEVFGGFETTPAGARIATPEKALFDVAYLSSTRSRLFHRLPEIELPPGFRVRTLREWVRRIPSETRRAHVGDRVDRILRSARAAPAHA